MYSLIQKPAPDFLADAIMKNNTFKKINLSEYQGKKYVILFFYPLNFTFVCPTEIIALSKKIKEFNERNVQVLGISVDSKFTHLAWKKTNIENGGIGPIKFPLISDISKEIARDYGVLINDSIALRGTFLIDKKGIIRHANVNDLPIGRNIHEILRIIDALQFFEKYGNVCPADWKKGKEGIQENPESIANYLKKYFTKL